MKTLLQFAPAQIIAFPSLTDPRLPARVKAAHPDLHELACPEGIATGATFSIFGENLLLGAAENGMPRYGCCAYLVTECGRKAVPVIGCRGWSRAPLPSKSHTHPVWNDLAAGLEEAVSRLATTPFTLEGAIVSARSWMSRHQTRHASHAVAAVLTGPQTHVLCSALPDDRPGAAASRPAKIIDLRPMLAVAELRLAA